MIRLRELRCEKGLSQRQLAQVICIEKSSVSKWENGRVKPDIETLIRLADYFDVSLDYLMGRKDYE